MKNETDFKYHTQIGYNHLGHPVYIHHNYEQRECAQITEDVIICTYEEGEYFARYMGASDQSGMGWGVTAKDAQEDLIRKGQPWKRCDERYHYCKGCAADESATDTEDNRKCINLREREEGNWLAYFVGTSDTICAPTAWEAVKWLLDDNDK